MRPGRRGVRRALRVGPDPLRGRASLLVVVGYSALPRALARPWAMPARSRASRRAKTNASLRKLPEKSASSPRRKCARAHCSAVYSGLASSSSHNGSCGSTASARPAAPALSHLEVNVVRLLWMQNKGCERTAVLPHPKRLLDYYGSYQGFGGGYGFFLHGPR